MPTNQKAAVTEDAIRVHAYHLWEQHGRPHGRDMEFWEKARTQIGTGLPMKSTAAPSAKAPAPVETVAAAKAAKAVKAAAKPAAEKPVAAKAAAVKPASKKAKA